MEDSALLSRIQTTFEAVRIEKQRLEKLCYSLSKAILQNKRRHKEHNQLLELEKKESRKETEETVDLSEIDKLLARARTVRSDSQADKSEGGGTEGPNIKIANNKDISKKRIDPSRTINSSNVGSKLSKTGRSQTQICGSARRTTASAKSMREMISSSASRHLKGSKNVSNGYSSIASGDEAPASNFAINSLSAKCNSSSARSNSSSAKSNSSSARSNASSAKSNSSSARSNASSAKSNSSSARSNSSSTCNDSTAMPTRTDSPFSYGNPEIISQCENLFKLKKKMNHCKSKHSDDATGSKLQFLNAAEHLFTPHFDYSTEEIPDSQSSEYHDFGVLVKQILESNKHSLSRCILSSMDFVDEFTTTKELCKFCHLILEYELLVVELKLREEIFNWASSILQSNDISMSEKIRAYRRFHGLLFEDCERLPTLIDDTEYADCTANIDE